MEESNCHQHLELKEIEDIIKNEGHLDKAEANHLLDTVISTLYNSEEINKRQIDEVYNMLVFYRDYYVNESDEKGEKWVNNAWYFDQYENFILANNIIDHEKYNEVKRILRNPLTNDNYSKSLSGRICDDVVFYDIKNELIEEAREKGFRDNEAFIPIETKEIIVIDDELGSENECWNFYYDEDRSIWILENNGMVWNQESGWAKIVCDPND